MLRLARQFLALTAWRMQTPKPYSAFVLSLTTVGIFLAVCTAIFLAKYSSRKIFCFCGMFLAISEVYKQGFLYGIVNHQTYDWWYFPFQLCSVPMYLCLILTFLPDNRCPRIRTLLCTFIQDFGLLGGIAALAEPTGLLHPYWTLTLHGLCWHFLLIFLGLYCCLSGQSDTTRSGFWKMLPLFGLCALLATCINVATHPYGNADMFYISPYYPNGQIVFHQIALKIGVTAGNLFYLLGVVVGAFLCHCLCHTIKIKRSMKS